MSSSIDRAVAFWRTQGVQLLPGLDSGRISSLASQFNVTLSADVVRLYSLCGGMPANVDDRSMFELWPLERALRESCRFPPGLVPFAEGFISAQLYLLRIESVEFSSVHIDYHFSGSAIECVAESLEKALEYLQVCPEKLMLPT